jgi:hypothetical protein
MGLAIFIITAVILSLFLAFIIRPFIYQQANVQFCKPVNITQSPAVALTFVGLLFGLYSFHLFNGIAAIFCWLSLNLLEAQSLAVKAELSSLIKKNI